jgi:RNA polymerase subunit RPABC4/transcription elongation factor Spt4
MALMKCHECGSEVSSEAKTCPKCGAKPKTTSNKISAIFGLIVILAVVLFFFGGGIEHQASKEMEKIEQQVATDVTQQYEIAKRNGNPIEVCVHAGMVSAAFLQAKDEANYKVWQKIQVADCKKAGMPM